MSLSDPQPEPPRREPAFNLPVVVLVCCLVLLGIQALRGLLSEETDQWIIFNFGFVPARAAYALGLAKVQLQAAYENIPDDIAKQLLGTGGGRWWSIVTYTFLHGGWLHVGLNCVWLAAFGSPVARRFGAARFLLLLLVAALLGAVVQFFWDLASFVPVVGASAAVAGAMGAATRFVFRPTDEPRRIFDRARLNDAFRQPALTLRQTLTTRTAVLFVLVWFATNLLFGLIPALSGMSDAAIAWQAHIGGFLAGLLLFPLFDPTRPEIRQALELEDSAKLPVGSSE